jgi:hypothetical protein
MLKHSSVDRTTGIQNECVSDGLTGYADGFLIRILTKQKVNY